MHTKVVAQAIKIQIPEQEALRGLLAVKPTAEMPRPATYKPAKKRIKKKTD
jgi:hypothetical protein